MCVLEKVDPGTLLLLLIQIYLKHSILIFKNTKKKTVKYNIYQDTYGAN